MSVTLKNGTACLTFGATVASVRMSELLTLKSHAAYGCWAR
jgi:hypothetical protein